MGRGFWGHQLPKIQELSAQSLLGLGAGKTSHWAGCFWLCCVSAVLKHCHRHLKSAELLRFQLPRCGQEGWSRFPDLSNGVILLSKTFGSVDRAKKQLGAAPSARQCWHCSFCLYLATRAVTASELGTIRKWLSTCLEPSVSASMFCFNSYLNFQG